MKTKPKCLACGAELPHVTLLMLCAKCKNDLLRQGEIKLL